MNTQDKINLLNERISRLEDKPALSRYDYLMLVWIARLVTGIATIITAMLAVSGLLTAWEKFTGFIK